jgi:hypothetical protein
MRFGLRLSFLTLRGQQCLGDDRKLSRSDRVKQVFVRHVIRYWMGRNEKINHAPFLQDAYSAYEGSAGSMKALLISLLRSDAILSRKVDLNTTVN